MGRSLQNIGHSPAAPDSIFILLTLDFTVLLESLNVQLHRDEIRKLTFPTAARYSEPFCSIAEMLVTGGSDRFKELPRELETDRLPK